MIGAGAGGAEFSPEARAAGRAEAVRFRVSAALARLANGEVDLGQTIEEFGRAVDMGRRLGVIPPAEVVPSDGDERLLRVLLFGEQRGQVGDLETRQAAFAEHAAEAAASYSGGELPREAFIAQVLVLVDEFRRTGALPSVERFAPEIERLRAQHVME